MSDLFKIGSLGLSKEELAATPFGTSVAKVQALIEKDMMPKVLEAHTMDQNELDKLAKALGECGTVQNGQHKVAKPSWDKYQAVSPKHQTCCPAWVQPWASSCGDRTSWRIFFICRIRQV